MQTILAVDDEAENLYLLQAIFQGGGFTVVTAANGAEALALARNSPPALVISDILMPVMDGFSLCREVRRDAALRDLPFIFYTATYTDPKDEKFAMSLGADLFLAKPLHPDVLLGHIRLLLARPRASVAPESAPTSTSEPVQLQEYNRVLIRKLEDKMVEAEKMNAELRALDRAKNDFLKVVSHEFRTPLMIIRATAELELEKEESKTEPDRILRATDRLLFLVENLIFMAGVLQKGEPRAIEEVAPNDLVTEAIAGVREKAASKEIRLRFEPPPPVKIRGNPRELRQALWNLLDNGVKFTPRGGTVTVSVAPGTDDVRFIIADAGIGIAPEEQQRIFERFYMIDSSPRRSEGGLGLGLSVVREIAELHGGRIEFESRVGQGSTFTLIIPR